MALVSNTEQVDRIAEKLVEAEKIKGRSLWRDSMDRFLRNKAAVGAMIVLFLVVLFTIIGPYFAQWSNEEIDWDRMGNLAKVGAPSCIWIAIGMRFVPERKKNFAGKFHGKSIVKLRLFPVQIKPFTPIGKIARCRVWWIFEYAHGKLILGF